MSFVRRGGSYFVLLQVFKRGGQLLLRLGDTDVPYSDEFRFFVTTKLANPHYMPEICIKVGVYVVLARF